jgi:hypothetical protein
MKWHRTALVTFVLAVSWVLAPGAADACAVCYGAADSPLTEGVNNGILVLLAVIAVVQVGFVALFLSIRQRARRERRRNDRFQLIRGGAG